MLFSVEMDGWHEDVDVTFEESGWADQSLV